MFKRLQNRILLLNMTLISLVMLLAFAAIYITTQQGVRSENLRKLMNAQPPTVVSNTEEPIGADESGASLSYMVSAEYTLSFWVEIDGDGHVLAVDSIADMPQEYYVEAAQLALADGKENGAVSLAQKDWMYKIDSSKLIQSENGVQTEKETGRYIMFLDVTESRQTMQKLLLTLVVAAVAVIVVFFGISLLFAKVTVKPISEAWRRQKQFVLDASHELKTPLSIINANRDAIWESRHETVESQAKWLGYIRAGTDRMAALIGQLLMLARLDDVADAVTWESVHVSALAREAAETMTALARDKNILLTCAIEPDIVNKSDREKLRAIMSILLDNAVKYGGSRVDVSVSKERRQIRFAVGNDGAGIGREDLPHVFDRFYRGDKSRQGDDGYGLGLSIAQALTQQLNGKISVESQPDVYTQVTLLLPL